MNLRTTAPTTPNPESVREERVLYERSLFGVLAGILGNCAAGLGVGLVAGVICHWLGASGVLLARVAVSAWLVGWGVLMALWFSADEFAVIRLRHDRDQALIDLAAAEDEIDDLQADNEQLLRDNALLTFKVQEFSRNRNFIPAVAPESQSYQDARALIRQWAETGKHPSKRDSALTETRHREAMSLLASVGIVRRNGRNVEWLAPDIATALGWLWRRQQASPEVEIFATPETPGQGGEEDDI